MTEPAPPGRTLVLRTLSMPGDLNAAGTMFGGWLLGAMDMAAGLAASAYCRGHSVTVAMNDVRFLRPLEVGQVVEGHATLQRVGRTSMTFRIEIGAGLPAAGETRPVCEAIFTMVALDSDGLPRAVSDRKTDHPAELPS